MGDACCQRAAKRQARRACHQTSTQRQHAQTRPHLCAKHPQPGGNPHRRGEMPTGGRTFDRTVPVRPAALARTTATSPPDGQAQRENSTERTLQASLPGPIDRFERIARIDQTDQTEQTILTSLAGRPAVKVPAHVQVRAPTLALAHAPRQCPQPERVRQRMQLPAYAFPS